MRSITLGLLAATMAFGVAVAQPATTGTTTSPMTGAGTPMNNSGTTGTPMGGTAGTMGTGTGMTGTGMTGAGMNRPGITGNNAANTTANSNGAVNTSSANNPTPASGANSFSMGEARRRIARSGYTNVADLKKDTHGVWRGQAQKDGQSVGVWLDYRGNIGQQ